MTIFNSLTCRVFDSLDRQRVPHIRILHHADTMTSQDSYRVRSEWGVEATGAKALVNLVRFRDGESAIAAFVMPSSSKFSSRLVRRHLGITRSRFLTPDELRRIDSALTPGGIPPFGPILLDKIDRLYIDKELLQHQYVGFNAGATNHSVVLLVSDLVAVAQPDGIFALSE